jgi:hypothetical protein
MEAMPLGGQEAKPLRGTMSKTFENPTPTSSARERFEQLTALAAEFRDADFQLTSEAEYAEVLQSIEDHKYLTNEKIPFEIRMDQALFCWFENLYHPMMLAIDEADLPLAFPGATRAQLFLWVSRHWHFLKQDEGREVGFDEAAISYGARFGHGVMRLVNRVRLLAA